MDQVRRDREAGGSLIAVLVVLVVIAALAALVLLALRRDPLGTATRLEDVSPGGDPAEAVSTSRPRSPTAGAADATCLANVRLVEQAATTKQATDGTFPGSVAELVRSGWLSEEPNQRGYELSMAQQGGRPTGQVLVNGQPAAQGCSGGPRPR